VLLSGLLWHGAPHTLIEHVRDGTLNLIASAALLGELTDVINRPKFQAVVARAGIAPDRLLSELRQSAEIIDPPPLAAPVSRDPDDDAILALAIAAQADVIVSGDKDLLALGSHAGIPIVDVAAALARINVSPG
jgi:putative PIN family toxin of toxin-antitoxin system